MSQPQIHAIIERRLEPVLRAEREARMRRALAMMLVVGALLVPFVAWFAQQNGVNARSLWISVGIAAVLAEILLVLVVRSRQTPPLEAARRIETEHPDLKGTLLAAMEVPAENPGYLQRIVLQTAVEHSTEHDWTGESLRRELKQRGALALMSAALFGLSVFGTSIMLKHQPHEIAKAKPEAVKNDSSFGGAKVTPGDAEVERGSRLTVQAKFDGRAPAEASVVLLNDDGTERARLPMNRTVDENAFGAVITDIAKDVKYRVESEAGVTATYQITTFDYPALARVDAAITPPSWTEQPKTVVKNTMNVSMMTGSRVDFTVTVNKPLAAAELFGEDKSIIPLKATSDARVLEAGFVPVKSQKYRVHLVDDRERANKNPPWITVRVLPNLPPKIELTFPKRDLAVSPVQELPVEGKVFDDLGVLRTGATFIVGGQTKEVVLGTDALKGGKSHVLKTMLDLEPTHAKPKQLVSYYLWAEDRGDDGKPRRAMSDMFFAEVRSFEDIFREAEAPPGEDKEQKEGEQGQAEKLLKLQKEVVNATWRVVRNAGDGRKFETVAPDVKVLEESQGIALKQTQDAIEKAKDAESKGILGDAAKAMELAVSQFHETGESAKSDGLTPAMGSTREALEQLYRLQAKEHRVMRSKKSQKSKSGREQQNQNELANLEMKQEERRYEEQSEAKEDSTEKAQQQENLQVLSRLKELAARQEALAQKMKELEQLKQQAKTDAEREEIDRQLKRLQEEQEQLLRDLDSLKERMEKPENVAQMSEMKDKMQQAREEARQAAEKLSQQQTAQAAANATKSQRQIEEARDEFRQKTAKQFAEDMRGLKEQAKKLEESEKRIAEQLENSAAPEAEIAGDTSKQIQRAMEGSKIARKIEEQQKALDRALDDARKISEAAENAEPALSTALYDAVRKAETGGTKSAMENAQQQAMNSNLERAQQQEERASKGIGELKENIERAAEKVLGSEADALRVARAELDKLTKEVEQAMNNKDTNGEANGEPKPDAEKGQRGGEQKLAQNDAKKGEASGKGEPNGEKKDDAAQAQNSQGKPQPGDGKEMPEGKGQPGEGKQTAANESKPGEGKGDGKPQAGDSKNQPDGKGQGGEGKQVAANEQKPGDGKGGSDPNGKSPEPNQSASGSQPNANGDPKGGTRTAMNRNAGGGREVAGNNNNGGGGGGGWFFNNQTDLTDNNPITGDAYERWSDRLRRVEELFEAQDLRADLARVRDEARQMRTDYKKNPVAPQPDAVRTRITQPLAVLRDRVNEELARHESKNPLAPLDRDPVPARYRELVRRYYTELGAGK